MQINNQTVTIIADVCCRDKEWNDQAVRSAVRELLKEMNQTKLSQLSPLSQTMISTIANSRYSAKITQQTCVAFGQWYDNYKQQPTSEEFSEGPPKDSRITFHPVYEIPQMRRWYKADKSPSEESLKYFLNELNKGPVRQDRPKLTLAKIKIWWKNERSREKKIQNKTAQKMLAELEEETAGLDGDSDFSDMLL